MTFPMPTSLHPRSRPSLFTQTLLQGHPQEEEPGKETRVLENLALSPKCSRTPSYPRRALSCFLFPIGRHVRTIWCVSPGAAAPSHPTPGCQTAETCLPLPWGQKAGSRVSAGLGPSESERRICAASPRPACLPTTWYSSLLLFHLLPSLGAYQRWENSPQRGVHFPGSLGGIGSLEQASSLLAYAMCSTAGVWQSWG